MHKRRRPSRIGDAAAWLNILMGRRGQHLPDQLANITAFCGKSRKFY
jgi:hypothetical protein